MKQTLLFIVDAAKENKWIAITIAISVNIINIWIAFAIGHFVPMSHWTEAPCVITAFIWLIFVAAITLGLCIEHHGDQ